jgi:hypothetical protein
VTIVERINEALDEEARGFIVEALKACGNATAFAFDGEWPGAAEEFERAGRLCRMAAETRRAKRIVERTAKDENE